MGVSSFQCRQKTRMICVSVTLINKGFHIVLVKKKKNLMRNELYFLFGQLKRKKIILASDILIFFFNFLIAANEN